MMKILPAAVQHAKKELTSFDVASPKPNPQRGRFSPNAAFRGFISTAVMMDGKSIQTVLEAVVNM
jgi:hypothetical protein